MPLKVLPATLTDHLTCLPEPSEMFPEKFALEPAERLTVVESALKPVIARLQGNETDGSNAAGQHP